MQIRSDRTWTFPAPPADVWAALGRVDDYPTWWPWLRGLEAHRLAVGECWTCTVQPPLPYSLTFRVTLVEVDAVRRVAATVDGDVVGTASIDLDDHPAGSRIRLVSRLGPGHRALQAVAAVARPLVRRSHDWVLDSGARQFGERALPPG